MAEIAEWLAETTKGMELEMMAERLVIWEGEVRVRDEELAYAEAELRTLREDKATLERRRLNCHELLLDCWNQFAQLPDGYSTQDLSTLENLEYALFDLGLIDDDGKPQWDELNAALDQARSSDGDAG